MVYYRRNIQVFVDLAIKSLKYNIYDLESFSLPAIIHSHSFCTERETINFNDGECNVHASSIN